MIVVDTNVWSELAKLQPNEHVRRWEADRSDQLWMSAIVLAEFRAGAKLMPAGRSRGALEQLIEALIAGYADRILVFDEACSRLYGEVLASAKAAGKPIQAADAMIAATARAHDMSVATRDRNDFAGAQVRLIDPWQP
ncbi:MAG TPA: PIN domain-containing protein [Allosphingosinicella sp.]|nr:PIN domain-containing protein [Allosphingosinicella sp.]